jgi:hypothetical protein
MSEQLRLFEADLRSWVERIWTKAGPEPRREIIAILAEMGRCAVQTQQEPVKEAKPDES